MLAERSISAMTLAVSCISPVRTQRTSSSMTASASKAAVRRATSTRRNAPATGGVERVYAK
jgi:hypothetical protein